MSRCPFASFNRALGLGDDSAETFDAAAEAKGMQRALKRGEEEGVYRKMLRGITASHSTGQKIRGAMFVAGLLTDKRYHPARGGYCDNRRAGATPRL